MRPFNYSAIKNQKWDSEILGYIAAIYKEAGKQELYLKQRPDELEKDRPQSEYDCDYGQPDSVLLPDPPSADCYVRPVFRRGNGRPDQYADCRNDYGLGGFKEGIFRCRIVSDLFRKTDCVSAADDCAAAGK